MSQDKLTKNDHFRAMVVTADGRGFAPDCVAFDGWYSSLENLKLIRSLAWRWLTRLKINRQVNLDRQGTKAVGETAIEDRQDGGPSPGGLRPDPRSSRIVSKDGDTEHWATDDLAMDELSRLALAERTWAISRIITGG